MRAIRCTDLVRTIVRIDALVCVAILLAVPAGWAVAFFTVGHHVDRASLSYSVAAHLDGYASCRPWNGAVWSCGGSTEQRYRLGPWRVVVSGRCWRAALRHGGTSPRRLVTFTGCVGIWDQLRFGDHFNLTVRPPGFY